MSTQAFETDTQNTAVDIESQAQPTTAPERNLNKEEHLVNDEFEVVLEPDDDPKELPLFRKWLAVLTICSAALCTTFASSAVRLDILKNMPSVD